MTPAAISLSGEIQELVTLADAGRLDSEDPLRSLRSRFRIPPGLVYLCGNSLGPLPLVAASRAREVIERQWAEDLIRSWNVHDWFGLPERIGARVARLIGAQPHEVVIADSTSINLFKVVKAALGLRPGRHTILSEYGNFPTNAYVLQGVARDSAGQTRSRAVAREKILASMDADTAVVVLTHVHYRDAAAFDIDAITSAAHAMGALVVWDLSHSVGAMPLDLNAADADFAIGCTYKYLNGGPGSPAFIFAAGRHHDALDPGLCGWWGHRAPFDLVEDYQPAPGMRRMLTGTASILALATLDAALEVFDGIDLAQVRAKSTRLTSAFVDLVQAKCVGFGIDVASPMDSRGRGSHVALRHPQAYSVMQALIARHVVGDFRAPDVMRFGFSPLYNGYRDVWDTVENLVTVLGGEEWRRPEFISRGRVT
jgi:kynureninase